MGTAMTWWPRSTNRDTMPRSYTPQVHHFAGMTSVVPEDLAKEDFLLGLYERTQGLDRTDLDACRQVINENRARCRADGCEYRTPEGILELRMNTGDWAYQGFADLNDGFDDDAYSRHYDLPAWRQKLSAYGRAMNRLFSWHSQLHGGCQERVRSPCRRSRAMRGIAVLPLFCLALSNVKWRSVFLRVHFPAAHFPAQNQVPENRGE